MRSEFSEDIIIWSADVTRDEIESVIRANAIPEGTVIKLDRLFFEQNDKSFISFCEDKGYPVFVDAKIIEIPVKTLAIAKVYLNYAPFMLNVMADVVSTGNWCTKNENDLDALKRFAELCHLHGTRSCAVTVLTSKSPQLVEQEFGNSAMNQVRKYVRMAHRAGISDIVCSPKEVTELRSTSEFNELWLNTPGVRPSSSNKDDQKRVMTPGEAIKAGANRLVIGRPLTSGEGRIEDRVASNYLSIRAEIERAITEINDGA